MHLDAEFFPLMYRQVGCVCVVLGRGGGANSMGLGGGETEAVVRNATFSPPESMVPPLWQPSKSAHAVFFIYICAHAR